MHRFMHSLRLFSAAIVLSALFCAGICCAAPSDHPVVTAITGPDQLNDPYGPTGSYTISATASGGSPPYTYAWYSAPAEGKLLSKGPGSSVDVPVKGFYRNGAGRYWIYLTVTDSAGKNAIFATETGTTSTEHCYGLVYEGNAWTKITCPQKFPKAASTAAPVRVATTAPSGACKDSGTRFVGINGMVEIIKECRDNYNYLAKLESVLDYDDEIKVDEDASAILGFSDMSTFMMKGGSNIVLSMPEKESKLKLVLGNIWMNVKKMAQNGSMEIDMNQAVAGIKGTTLVCSTDGTTDTVQVIEGTVEVTSKRNGEKVLVGAGQQVKATSWGVTDPAPFDVASVTADWDAVKAKTMAGKPADAPKQKSGLESALVIAGIGFAAAAYAIRRM